MPDYADRYTDRKISEVDKRLRQTYRTAQKELKKKLADFNRRSAAKDKVMRQKVADGKISKSEYKSWLAGQVFIRGQWEDKVKQVDKVMFDHNQQAMNLINNSRLDTFAENYNYMSFQTEKVVVTASFNLYNAEAVSILLMDDPKILPEWKVDEPKDYKWNSQKVNNIVTQGIIQGESIDRITDRLCTDLCTQNENRMRMFARTAMTEAENAGRQRQMHDSAERFNIVVHKRWEATHDSRTRDWHRALDGQEVPENEPFESELGEIEYPGDPGADPANVYNCRCTMVSIYPEYEDREAAQQRYEEMEIDGKDYFEWKAGKEAAKGSFEKEGDLIFGGSRSNELNLTKEQRRALIQEGLEKSDGLVFSKDTATNNFPSNAKKAKPDPDHPDFIDVISHGNSKTIKMFGKDIDGYILAGIISQKSEYIKGRGIRLLACEAGKTWDTGDCIAQILANEMNVRVYAPIEELYAKPDGTLSVKYYGESKEGWKEFYPRGKQR